MLKLSAGKTELYRKQRVVGRLGDGDLTTIDIYLLQEDGYAPYILTDEMILTFKGNLSNGEYTEGPIIIQNKQEGYCQYTFSKENFSSTKEYKRAYIELVDASGATTTFQDFQVDVLSNADLSQGQVQLYVSKLDTLLKEFSESYNQFVLEKESNFQTFLEEKVLQYQEIYNQYNDLVRRLNESDQRMTSLENDQETIIRLINENNVATKEELEQAKQESSANVINQISGAESAFAKKEFLVNGVEGTGARENNDSFTPFSPEDYASLVSDTGVVRVETLIDGRGAESEFQFPLINIIGERYPDFFEGLSTIAEKITRCKDKIRKVIVPSEFRGGGARYTGTGSVSNYSRLYIKNISNDNGGFWGTTATNSTASYRAFNTVIDATSMKQIQPDGSYVFKIVTKNNKSSENGIVSDGTTAAWIEIKDLRLIVEIEMNGRTLILSMMAAYSGENSVSLIGNQSIAGVKNFLSAPMVDGKRVATIQDLGEIVYVGSGLTTIQSDKRSSFDEFVYQFIREGNEVRFFGRVKVKDATAITNSSADLIVPPIGFGMASNLKNSVSGVTLDTSQWTLPQGNYIGLLVNDGGSTPIKFSSNKTGNVYISGSWPTDEAWPT